MITFLYNIFLSIFFPFYWLYRLVNNKFKSREIISRNYKHLTSDNKKIWFHSASMGEFEQAKPIIEKIKTLNPDIQIICSFFSPSGYENQKYYPYADVVLYLPFDFKNRAEKFIKAIKPDIAVFIRYELWRNYLVSLKKLKIPAFLVCATFPSGRPISSFPLSLFTRSNLNLFEEIYTFNNEHFKKFRDFRLRAQIVSSTDTRYDRIKQISAIQKAIEQIPDGFYNENDLVWICGSTWEPDENIILEAYNKLKPKFKQLKLIIVPHEPTTKHIEQLTSKIDKYVFFTDINNDKFDRNNDVVIVNTIGVLLKLYSLASFAYVGGAYGAGVHSVAEPAGFGIPLSCGTKYQNSPIAVDLKNQNALEIIKNAEELYNWLSKCCDSENFRAEKGLAVKNYIDTNSGATDTIVNELLKHL